MLYIVGTPIGNLEDFSIRGAKTILSVDVVLAEDTRSAMRMIDYAKTIISSDRNPTQKVIPYHKDNEYEKLSIAIDSLNAGKNVAIVSEAGMPIISDPGLLLVNTCHKNGIPVRVIPGPSAVDSAVALCGLQHHQFHFVGFFPRKKADKVKLLNNLEAESLLHKRDVLFVAYESSERLSDTITSLNSLPNPPKVVLCREMSKVYEEVIIDPSKDTSYRGELAICFKFE